ncbi:hypothetical protein C7974DRAFT_206176 [Boeremia exigua]|uniref:uncharacterized protein n=1 Tax=Boeremia exigua TaxID=749465 RepID=UPI001E8CE717|nr:uncharacterized protein C7974DRAFT_206176 [Boeremia exigua]KAH6625712.1 hypothetical protein C7974DRAFT_206176 [Boeremia exigua]
MRRVLLACLGLLALLPSIIARRNGFECSVRSNTTLVPDVAAALVQYGAASELATGFKQPWPEVDRKGRKMRIVKYCYSEKHVRDHLDCPRFRDAFDKWRQKLDSPAFKGTTNLYWEELSDGNPDRSKRQPRYCYDADKNWDSKNVPHDTLAIRIDRNAGKSASSTVGYDPTREKDLFGYHIMNIGPDVTTATIAHELGHVFGMVHEHNRHDSDDYVHFECKSLPNYSETIALARVENKLNYADAHEKLCNDREFADRYKFGSSDFVKDPFGRIHDEPTIPFDYKSIMLYDSLLASAPACEHDLSVCVLLRYSGDPPNKQLPLERLKLNEDPSDGDAKFVQRWYPAAA